MFRPVPLDPFATGTADTLEQMERVLVMPFLLVGAEVVHRNCVANIGLVQFDTKMLREFQDSFLEIYRPLTNDIVR